MIFITENRNSKIAKMVSNDFPNVVIIETIDDDIYSKLDVEDNIYIDSNIISDKLESIKLYLEINPKVYKTIEETPKGYSFK